MEQATAGPETFALCPSVNLFLSSSSVVVLLSYRLPISLVLNCQCVLFWGKLEKELSPLEKKKNHSIAFILVLLRFEIG